MISLHDLNNSDQNRKRTEEELIFLEHASNNSVNDDLYNDYLPILVFLYVKNTILTQFIYHIVLSIG